MNGRPLFELIAEEEEARAAETRREMDAELAAWNALSPEERAAIEAEREAKWAAHADAIEAAEAEGPDDEDEPEDDDDDREFD